MITSTAPQSSRQSSYYQKNKGIAERLQAACAQLDGETSGTYNAYTIKLTMQIPTQAGVATLNFERKLNNVSSGFSLRQSEISNRLLLALPLPTPVRPEVHIGTAHRLRTLWLKITGHRCARFTLQQDQYALFSKSQPLVDALPDLSGRINSLYYHGLHRLTIGRILTATFIDFPTRNPKIADVIDEAEELAMLVQRQ